MQIEPDGAGAELNAHAARGGSAWRYACGNEAAELGRGLGSRRTPSRRACQRRAWAHQLAIARIETPLAAAHAWAF